MHGGSGRRVDFREKQGKNRNRTRLIKMEGGFHCPFCPHHDRKKDIKDKKTDKRGRQLGKKGTKVGSQTHKF